MTFEEALIAWLPQQRWFAGKGTPITGLAIAEDTTLVAGDPGLRHLILAVSQSSGTDSYQVFAGTRADLPGWLDHARIGPAGEGLTAYDGLHDPELTRTLLAAMAGEQSIGPLRFAHTPGRQIVTGLDSLALTAEQSNTSLLFGEEAILKVFRRPSPGPNPDLEVPAALARLGSPHVAEPLGWIETMMAGTPTVLAVLSTYLRAAVDGWSLAATSVRDPYASGSVRAAEAGGDFAGEAHRLGEATAEVHRDLAVAFGVDELPAAALREMSAQMRGRLARCRNWPAAKAGCAWSSTRWPRSTAHWKCSGSTATTTSARRCAHTPAGCCWTSRASPRCRWRSGGAGSPRCATWRGCCAHSTTPPAFSSPGMRMPSRSPRRPGTGC